MPHIAKPFARRIVRAGGLTAFVAVVLSSCHSTSYLDRYGDLSRIPNEPRVGQLPSQPGTGGKVSASAVRKAASALGVTYSHADNPTLLQACAEWLGVPYVYGGNTKDGVDCSGFTCQIYRSVYGKKLHRRSRDQHEKDVRHKSRSRLRQGDLVFFSSPSSSGSCGHVGIYLKENKFIHVSSSRGVVVDCLDGKYWTRNWLGGGEAR